MRWAAEEKGYAPAMWVLGSWYGEGKGVQQDMLEGAKWARRAYETLFEQGFNVDAPRGAWHQFQGLVAARTRSSQVSMPMASSRTESKPQSACHLPGAEAGTLAVARGTCFRQHSTSPSTDRPVW